MISRIMVFHYRRLEDTFGVCFFVEVLQWLVLCGILLRFGIHGNLQDTLLATIVVIGLLVFNLTNLYLLFTSTILQNSQQWAIFRIIYNTIFFSLAYYVTNEPQSDFFLFYFLPLLIAADTLDFKQTIAVSSLISFSLLIMILTMSAGEDIITVFLRIALPRCTFYFGVLTFVLARERMLRNQRNELDLLNEVSIEISQVQGEQDRLDVISKAAMKLLRSQGSLIYLKTASGDLRLAAVEGSAPSIMKVGYTLKVNTGMAGRILETGEAELVDNYKDFPYRVDELAPHFTALLEVPLKLDKSPIGVLCVFDDNKVRTFNMYDKHILERLSIVAILALRNVQLLEQEIKLRSQSDLLRKVSDAVASDLNIQGISEVILDSLENILDFSKATMQVIRGDSRYLVASKYIKDEDISENLLKPISQDKLVSHIVSSKQIYVIASTHEDDLWIATPTTDDVNSWIGIPLVYDGDEVVGLITVDHDQEEKYHNGFKELLNPFAVQAAVAIRKALLISETEQYANGLTLLHRMVFEIIQEHDYERVLQKLVIGSVELTGWEASTIYTIEYDNNKYTAVQKLSHPPDFKPPAADLSRIESITRSVIETGNKEVISEVDNQKHPIIYSLGIRALVALPLRSTHNIVGVLYLFCYTSHHFNTSELKLLDTLAGQAAIAIMNSQLIDDISEANRKAQVAISRLEEANTLAMIGIVYGEDAHLSSNKLGAAKQYALNIQDDPIAPQEVIHYAKRIQKNIDSFLQTMRSMQRDILPPYPTRVDIIENIEAVLETMAISPSISIRREYTDLVENPFIIGLERQFRQIIRVIIYNALTAMPSGKGNLSIHLEDTPITTISYIKITITDTGRGIPKDRVPYIFDFQKSPDSRNTKSFGFGLAWARSVIRWYGGDISYEPNQPKGTTMIILVPRDFNQIEKVLEN